MPSFVIIDDSMVMRTILRYMIERGGASVLGEGKDGEEAVALASELQPDAITLATTLRGEEGLAVLAALQKSLWKGKVFLALSAEQSAEEDAVARSPDVDGVLRKPFILDQVCDEIVRVMSQGHSPVTTSAESDAPTPSTTPEGET